MIKVLLQVDSENRPLALEVKGHSDIAPKGMDPICAAVSAIVQLIESAISRNSDKYMITKRTGLFKITGVAEKISLYDAGPQIEFLIKESIVFLKELESEYPKQIKIEAGG